jgi:hypothetical protein
MLAIAKTDFLASVANPDRDGYSVLMELWRSPALLIVLSGQQDHGGLIRALDVTIVGSTEQCDQLAQAKDLFAVLRVRSNPTLADCRI